MVDYDPEWPRLFRSARRSGSGPCWGSGWCGSSTSGRPRSRAWPPSRSSTSCWSCPTRRTSRPGSRTWRRPGTGWSSGSPTGSSTAASRGRTRTSTCTSTRPAAQEIERYLLFRDRLRASPEDRAHYQRVKRELAERDWTYVQEYADAKTEVVEAIIARARAAGTGGLREASPGGVHNSFTAGRQHRERPEQRRQRGGCDATDDGGRGGDPRRPGRDRDRGRGLQRRGRRGDLPGAGPERRHRPGGQGRRATAGATATAAGSASRSG